MQYSYLMPTRLVHGEGVPGDIGRTLRDTGLRHVLVVTDRNITPQPFDTNVLGVEVMPHFLPGLFDHLAAVTPSVTLLEDFPLLEPLLDGLPAFEGGAIAARPVTGHGLSLKPDYRAKLV